MKILHDKFDTDQLGLQTIKIYIDEADEQDDIELSLTKPHSGLVSCFCPAQVNITKILEAHDFNFISIRNTYILGFGKEFKPAGVQFEIKTPADKSLQKSDIIRIAEPVYAFSRYFRDPKINKEKGLALYSQWIENSVYNGYADVSFVAYDGAKTIGLCTGKIKEGKGYIDLLSVLTSYQNKKVGIALISKCIDFLRAKNVQDIYVITEGENIQANRFYQKCGFILQSVELVYHKHTV